jgi:hypothetical protein
MAALLLPLLLLLGVVLGLVMSLLVRVGCGAKAHAAPTVGRCMLLLLLPVVLPGGPTGSAVL